MCQPQAGQQAINPPAVKFNNVAFVLGLGIQGFRSGTRLNAKFLSNVTPFKLHVKWLPSSGTLNHVLVAPVLRGSKCIKSINRMCNIFVLQCINSIKKLLKLR